MVPAHRSAHHAAHPRQDLGEFGLCVYRGRGGLLGAGGKNPADAHGRARILQRPARTGHDPRCAGPLISVNLLLVDFKKINGATRFVPGTQRSRAAIPALEDEPEWMRGSILCAPAGTVVIRDVRCWHGGTANRSDEVRAMLDVLYLAPWFRLPNQKTILPKVVYKTFSPRAKALCRFIVEP
ncbi:MAG: hypothetical protein EXS58_15310 [Candidatus Latescibacteria bacterium]|nr:hypothetical protein [Candidatus Latescibacterota bacterium]